MMMCTLRELTTGSIEIYHDQTLGIGSYGKVCKAKCGQLPCAAKLLHDTLFQDHSAGTQNLMRRFEQECQFLSTIKHPNIVQYLGTTRDPQFGRPVLLMELMDRSLTKFLEQSTDPLSYHIQLNICHDVALALSYLHSNAIVHRDLSSNNVLLIGEGNRAKVTDFGMSKLMDMNSRMTPLTQCPGTSAYMPPEALSATSQYSNKLDCFSYGVLTIQIITRNFPNPGDANRYVEDPNYSTGRVLVQFPEKERRKADIDLIHRHHPLRSISLHCLADREDERPLANELCERLATLKKEGRYTQSVELVTEHSSSSQWLVQEIERSRESLELEFAEKEKLMGIIKRNREEIQKNRADIEWSRIEVEKCKIEITDENEKHRQEIEEKEQFTLQVIEDCSKQLKEIQRRLESTEQNLLLEQQLRQSCQEELKASDDLFSRNLAEAEMLSAPSRDQNQHQRDKYVDDILSRSLEAQMLSTPSLRSRSQSQKQGNDYNYQKLEVPKALQTSKPTKKTLAVSPVSLTWKQGRRAPEAMESVYGSAAVCGDTAYFSTSETRNIFSYACHNHVWSKLPHPRYYCFSLAVVRDKLTTVGGTSELYNCNAATNALLSLRSFPFTKWKEVFPPMPTKRTGVATVTTANSLVVAGGEGGRKDKLTEVEVMMIDTLQWFRAISIPQPLPYPQMAICNGHCFICADSTMFSCSLDNLLTKVEVHSSSVWKKRADAPVQFASGIVSVKRELLTIGGRDAKNTPTAAVHRFDPSSESWTYSGKMPTPRSHVLAATLPSDEVLVVGGMPGNASVVTEIGKLRNEYSCILLD